MSVSAHTHSSADINIIGEQVSNVDWWSRCKENKRARFFLQSQASRVFFISSFILIYHFIRNDLLLLAFLSPRPVMDLTCGLKRLPIEILVILCKPKVCNIWKQIPSKTGAARSIQSVIQVQRVIPDRFQLAQCFRRSEQSLRTSLHYKWNKCTAVEEGD